MANQSTISFHSLYASRLYSRSPVDLRTRLVALPQVGNPVVVYGRTRDLSRSGAGVTLTGNLQSGAEVLFCLRMPESGEALCLRAVVARRTGSVAGLRFVDPTLSQRRQLSRLCFC